MVPGGNGSVDSLARLGALFALVAAAALAVSAAGGVRFGTSASMPTPPPGVLLAVIELDLTATSGGVTARLRSAGIVPGIGPKVYHAPGVSDLPTLSGPDGPWWAVVSLASPTGAVADLVAVYPNPLNWEVEDGAGGLEMAKAADTRWSLVVPLHLHGQPLPVRRISLRHEFALEERVAVELDLIPDAYGWPAAIQAVP